MSCISAFRLYPFGTYEASAKGIAGDVVTVTDSSSSSEDWLGEAPEIAESDITETLSTEVPVVGCGTGGHSPHKTANAEAYRSALPNADSFKLSNSAENYIEEYGWDVYGSGDFGRVYINQAVLGYDASGNLVGYAVRVTTADGFEGNVVLTAGMGMRVDEEYKIQVRKRKRYAGRGTPRRTLL